MSASIVAIPKIGRILPMDNFHGGCTFEHAKLESQLNFPENVGEPFVVKRTLTVFQEMVITLNSGAENEEDEYLTIHSASTKLDLEEVPLLEWLYANLNVLGDAPKKGVKVNTAQENLAVVELHCKHITKYLSLLEVCQNQLAKLICEPRWQEMSEDARQLEEEETYKAHGLIPENLAKIEERKKRLEKMLFKTDREVENTQEKSELDSLLQEIDSTGEIRSDLANKLESFTNDALKQLVFV